MDQVREALRYRRCAYRTEQTCCQRILRYLHYFGGKTHPRLPGAKYIEALLSPLTAKANQPPRSKLSRYEMNVIISQQAAENQRASRNSGIKGEGTFLPDKHIAWILLYLFYISKAGEKRYNTGKLLIAASYHHEG